MNGFSWNVLMLSWSENTIFILRTNKIWVVAKEIMKIRLKENSVISENWLMPDRINTDGHGQVFAII